MDKKKNMGKKKKKMEKKKNSLRAISLVPTVFSKDVYYRNVKTKACLGKGERR